MEGLKLIMINMNHLIFNQHLILQSKHFCEKTVKAVL